MLLAAGEIQIETVQTKSVSFCFGPIRAREVRVFRGRTVQREEAAPIKPRVQVYSAVKRSESVIGHDNQLRVRFAAHDFAKTSIYILVDFQQLRFVFAPEHVRVLVDGREIEKKQAAVEMPKRVAQKLPLIFKHKMSLRKELRQREDALSQRCCVFRDAESEETAGFVRDGLTVRRGRGKRQRRREGIDVDRSDIKLEKRM